MTITMDNGMITNWCGFLDVFVVNLLERQFLGVLPNHQQREARRMFMTELLL